MIAQCEGHALSRFALLDCDALFDFPAFKNIRDVERDDIDPAQAGVDGKTEHGDVAGIAFLREQRADRGHLLWCQGRFTSDDFALVPGLFLSGHIGAIYAR